MANVALSQFDRAVLAAPGIVSYKRYVDDFVVVAKVESGKHIDFKETLERFVPAVTVYEQEMAVHAGALGRNGSEFTLQSEKIKIHHLQGLEGRGFIDTVKKDFAKPVSDRRVFIDSSAAIEDALSQLVLARKDESPLRVLRDAEPSQAAQL